MLDPARRSQHFEAPFELQTQHPEATKAEIAKMCSDNWNASVRVKNHYKQMADNDKLRFEHRAYISGRSRRVTDTGDGADVRSRTSCTGKNDPRDGNTFTH